MNKKWTIVNNINWITEIKQNTFKVVKVDNSFKSYIFDKTIFWWKVLDINFTTLEDAQRYCYNFFKIKKQI